ncbi:peptidylprolyl isomerase [Mucilaginibacter robiniae]|uniref:peptidylprolyl isomerase n=1 Tax=Mucilaginibacter robiniae TaxID=2728022 RepID=A0A7L5E179_9SPHI|nr:FKBP-type peptidyl-prolyl cis-trans isomerase [Mucilaginibacter robiniae]QJD96791.1 peptidylprolyl isomerase [Mucilaginibacter robiniae]
MKKLFVYLLLSAAFIYQAAAQATFSTTPKGARYRIITHGNGQRIKRGDVVAFNFIQKTSKDSVLGSSYQRGQLARVQVDSSKNVSDLMEVFPLLSVNDSAEVQIPTDSIFAKFENQRPPFLPKGSYMIFDLKIVKVQSLDEAMTEYRATVEKSRAEQATANAKLQAAEVPAVNQYLTAHKLMPKTTASGLKYVITKAGTGPKPLAGDTLLVNYTGRTLDGKVFDSSVETIAKASGLDQPGRPYEPFKFTVGNHDVISGWDEGLLLMNEGSKATFIIPSALAYGERGAGNDIKPFSPLAFDIELVKVTRGVHKPAPVAQKSTKKPISRKLPVRKKVSHK